MFYSRAKLCYEERIPIKDVFDEKTGEVLENLSAANSIPPEFLIPPFLSGCGHFLGKSVVCPWGTWKQPAIIYSTTVGFTGTNKSAAMDVIKNAIQKVETAQGISFQNSRINQSATVESLLKQLTQDNRQIMMWDELKTWQTSLGLYKSGAASDYDTTIYLTAYNGGSLKRQTCSSNTAIQHPVLNLIGMSHPGEICKRLDDERKSSDNNDGLYSRFLMCMPEPVFSFADEVVDLRPDLPSLAKLYYVVEKIHTTPACYTYAPESLETAKQYYNDQQTYLQTNHQNDTFLSGMIGKAKGQVHRLAMIIEALSIAQNILHQVGEDNGTEITEDFKKKFDTHVKESTIEFHINLSSTEKSISAIKYFLLQKKFLAGYTNDKNIKPGNVNDNLVKKILLWPGKNVKCQDVARCSRNNAETIKLHMKELSDNNLGKVNMERPVGGGRVTVVFAKTDVSELDMESAMQFSDRLIRYGVRFDEYRSQLENTENVLCPTKKQKTT